MAALFNIVWFDASDWLLALFSTTFSMLLSHKIISQMLHIIF